MVAPWRFLPSRWPWLALVYVVTSGMMSLALTPVVALTLLLLPLWGILVAALERRRIRLLGLRVQPSGHVHVPREERRNWLSIRLMEPATWREAGSLLVGLVFGVAAVAVLGAQAVIVGVVVAVITMATSRDIDLHLFGDVHVVFGPSSWWWVVPAIPVVLAVFAYLNALLAAVQAASISWLIAPRTDEIDRRVEQLTRSRAAIVAAHERERRRIERDLHDGVQQELVAIAARLGMLELELDGAPEARRNALRAAQEQTERALRALRETVRGIHPAVLSDHGLVAAVEELAGRSAIPLRVEDRGFPRLDTAVEAAAYFFVAETVSNAAKHTAAPVVRVRLGVAEQVARVEVSDAGQGGIDIGRGTGLRGLAERADALGGEVTITSPPGGPTRLVLSLPVADPQGSGREGKHAYSARG